MTIQQWLMGNSYLILATVFLLLIIGFNRIPNIAGWQSFLDSFESKGGQLLLLVVTDFIILTVLVRYWKGFDAQLQTTMVGLLSGVNGAFLGAVGARQPAANGSNGNGGGNGGSTPAPIPSAPIAPAPPAPAVASSSSTTPVSMGFAPRHIGHVGDRGDHGDLGTNNLRGAS